LVNEDIRARLESAKRTYNDVGPEVGLSDEDVVWLARAGSGREGYLAEMGRRQIAASGQLEKALEDTSHLLLWTTRLLGVYTAAL